ncbi:PREDICTED: deoxycytidylate deaminase-like [Diuraphis noxia]|uniref:deoxycytidylate deaminase-like n=1 Tax=Diuraphis noxia TaxID=143948 RepID=UPI0007639EF7|nr:PREDICTED: deoxycytidylate deaminase-like [Diuraphis noxia]
MTHGESYAKCNKGFGTKVGACIIVYLNKKIVSIGYNGMPTVYSDNDFSWGKSNSSELENKFIYVCHAEMNAVFYKSSINVKGCTYPIHVLLFLCMECAKIIIQLGIKNFVYFLDPKDGKNKNKYANKIFLASGVQIRNHMPNLNIILDFSKTT